MQFLALIIFLSTVFITWRVTRKNQGSLNGSPMVKKLKPADGPPKYTAQEMKAAQKELEDMGIGN